MKMVRSVAETQVRMPGAPHSSDRPNEADGRDFRGILDSKLKLSKHVCQRIDRRQLNLGPDRMRMLESAVSKAASKGARESLVLLDNLALLVSVENRTVITAVDRGNMKEGVFTQIDSAIIV
jgi:flagellar operon protein